MTFLNDLQAHCGGGYVGWEVLLALASSMIHASVYLSLVPSFERLLRADHFDLTLPSTLRHHSIIAELCSGWAVPFSTHTLVRSRCGDVYVVARASECSRVTMSGSGAGVSALPGVRRSSKALLAPSTDLRAPFCSTTCQLSHTVLMGGYISWSTLRKRCLRAGKARRFVAFRLTSATTPACLAGLPWA